VTDSFLNRVAEATFRLGLKGYSVIEVDRLLRELTARLVRGETIPPAEIKAASFRKMFKGYNCKEVDAFLAELAADLEIA
jgi:DivIVA domain-containing protein